MTTESGYLFTSESVTEGHPDKISDQISDAILDAALAKDPKARVACETLVTTGLVVVAGEITTDAVIDYGRVARETIREIGYTRAKFGFDCDTCAVLSALDRQSPDIAMGVDTGGAGDQGLMFGYACNETPELMPLPILSIKSQTPARGRTHRFDIEVEGTHNYFADGVMVHNSPETTTGGRALKFYASVRLDVRRIEALKDGTDTVGNRTRVKVVKNKVSAPFKVAEFDIVYGQGISRAGSLIDVGVEQGSVRKSGAWYTYEGDQLGQGKENARKFLKEHEDVANEIEKKILEKLGVGPTVDAEVPPAEPTGVDDF